MSISSEFSNTVSMAVLNRLNVGESINSVEEENKQVNKYVSTREVNAQYINSYDTTC